MLLVILIGAYLTYERPESASSAQVPDPLSLRPTRLILDFRICNGAQLQMGAKTSRQ